MTVADKTGDIRTKESFGSMQLHIEWRSPAEVMGKNQSRANSGIFLQELYEIQVLDNNQNYLRQRAGRIDLQAARSACYGVYPIWRVEQL
jgi:Domain of Unknown Function (DUF1080).